MSIMPSSSGGPLSPSKPTGDSTAPNLKRKRLAEWEKDNKVVATQSEDEQIVATQSKVASNQDDPIETTTCNPSLLTSVSVSEKTQDVAESSRSQQKRRIKGGIKAWEDLAKTLLQNDNTQLQSDTSQEERILPKDDTKREKLRQKRLKKLEEKLENAKSVNIVLEDIVGTEWHTHSIKTIRDIKEKKRLFNIYTERYNNYKYDEKQTDSPLFVEGFLSPQDWVSSSDVNNKFLTDIKQDNQRKLTTCMALKLAIGYSIRNKYISDNKVDISKLNGEKWEDLQNNTPVIHYHKIKCNLSDFLNIIPSVVKEICSVMFPDDFKKKPFPQPMIARKTEKVIKYIREYTNDIKNFNQETSTIILKDMFDIINNVTRILFSGLSKVE